MTKKTSFGSWTISHIQISDNSFQSTSPWTIGGYPPWCTEPGFYPLYNVGNFAGPPAVTIHKQLDPSHSECVINKIGFRNFLCFLEATYPNFDDPTACHDLSYPPNFDFSSPLSPSSGCSSCSATFSDSSTYPPSTSLSSQDVEIPSFPDMSQASWASHHPSSEYTRSESSPPVSDQENASRRRFACLMPGCARRFTSQYTLKVHMEAHKPKPRTIFPCTLGCSETFSRQHDRLRHEVAKHGKVCDWLCNDCGRFFSSKKTLGNHKCPCAPGGTRWVTETVSRIHPPSAPRIRLISALTGALNTMTME
jgi:hypothetical protein